MSGILNFQIEDAIKKIGDNDLSKNFVGVLLSNYMNRFIDHASMISDKGKHLFIIANMDASDKLGAHWWSIRDIEHRNNFFIFYSFGLDELSRFIVQDDKPIVDKILLGIEQMTRTDNKITLCMVKFNLGAYKNLAKAEIDSLTDTARNLFRFIQDFCIKLKLRNFVNIWMVEDTLQDRYSATCGIFQLYFYENLFNPDENSKTQNQTKLTKKTVETLLNELFPLDVQKDEIKRKNMQSK